MSADYLASRLWFVRRKGQLLGPFSPTELRKLSDRGNLAPFDEVAETKGGPWQTVEALFAALEPPKPMPVPSDTGTAPVVNAPTVSYGTRDYRLVSIGIGLLTFGQLFEVLAGLCMVTMILVVVTNGNQLVGTVFSVLFIVMSLTYHILLNLGYGFATSGSADIAPRALPVTNLILHIIDFLLDAITFIMLTIGSTPALRDGFSRNMEPVEVAFWLIVGARVLMWIPMMVICIEWLKAIGRRIDQFDAEKVATARSIKSQSMYFYILCAFRYLIFALIVIIRLLADNPVSDKMRISLLITSILYLILITAVAFWRTGLLYLAWRMTSTRKAF